MNKHIEKKIIKQVAPFITATGIHRLFASRYAGLGHILMFHRVLPDPGGARIHNHESLEITVEQLEGIIRYYKKYHFRFLPLGQLPEYLSNRPQSDRFVVFTFDDGYADNYLHAAPVFEKYNIPFTVYITTDFPDRKAILWWYYLEELLLENDRIAFAWKGQPYHFACHSHNSKERLFHTLRTLFIQAAANDEAGSLLKVLFGSPSFDPFEKTDKLAMNWNQIKELASGSLATLGAHTVRHLPLSKMNPEEARREIVGSREILESHTGIPVKHFSYPFGSPNEAGEREFRMVKDCGFQTATTTRFSTIHPEHGEFLTALPRITVNSLVSIPVLRISTSGMLPALRNGFAKVMTD